ncbi:MAG: hypothetical protein K5765_00670 [Clostridia bacterium]|nr:hypothetical protein [Clostridia bacterium]
MAKKTYDDDDGRVIAPMDDVSTPSLFGHIFTRSKKAKTADEVNLEEKAKKNKTLYQDLSLEEKREYNKDTRAIIRGIIISLLPYIGIILGIFTIVILIMWLCLK